MKARTLNGEHIGSRLIWDKGYLDIATGETRYREVFTGKVTMILHKKNHSVIVRHYDGKRQRDETFRPDFDIKGWTLNA